MKVKIALAQYSPLPGMIQHNLKIVEAMAEEATEKGSHIFVLPELFATSMVWEKISEFSEEPGGKLLQSMVKMAETTSMAIVAGSIIERENDRYYNTNYLIDSDGSVKARYRKIHLFGALEEGSYITSGNSVSTGRISGIKASAFICYDLRFPEPSRLAVVDGAEILFYPSQFLDPRGDHFRTLLKARAIENFCFTVGCNRVGSEGNGTFFGSSGIWDPWGKDIVLGGTGTELIIGEADMNSVQSARRRIRIFEDRKPEAYHLDNFPE